MKKSKEKEKILERVAEEIESISKIIKSEEGENCSCTKERYESISKIYEKCFIEEIEEVEEVKKIRKEFMDKVERLYIKLKDNKEEVQEIVELLEEIEVMTTKENFIHGYMFGRYGVI